MKETRRREHVKGNQRMLVDEEKPAGVYELRFNAQNLSSGMYLYRLRAGDFVSTKRMLILK